jgi:uncharacterized protein (DUF2147 family)
MLGFCQMRMWNFRFGRCGFLAALLCTIHVGAFAAEPTPAGLWKTIDDKTGQPRGFVRLYESEGKIFGVIDKSLEPKEAAERCDLCTGERKNQPVIGMVFLRGMKKDGAEYSGGDILDPDTGVVYRCKFRLLDQGRKLVVRGYIGVSLFGRSQTWTRAAESEYLDASLRETALNSSKTE